MKKQLVAREQEIVAVQARMQASYREHVKEVQQLQGKVGRGSGGTVGPREGGSGSQRAVSDALRDDGGVGYAESGSFLEETAVVSSQILADSLPCAFNVTNQEDVTYIVKSTF